MRRLFRKRVSKSGFSVASFAPIIDIFTILVVAILKSSSTQAPPQFPESNVRLPLSGQEYGRSNIATIDIAQDGIYYNRTRVTSTAYWERETQTIVTELYSILLLQPPAKIQLRADSSTPWLLIDKTLLTIRQAGCNDIELLAESRSSL